MRKEFVFFSITSLFLVITIYLFLWPPIVWVLVLLLPLILLGFYDMFQSRHAIKRNFPIL